MSSKQTFDELANRIRLGIDKSEYYTLFKEDLTRLWHHDVGLMPEEKTMLIHNFALTYGFKVMVKANLTLATFYALSP